VHECESAFLDEKGGVGGLGGGKGKGKKTKGVPWEGGSRGNRVGGCWGLGRGWGVSNAGLWGCGGDFLGGGAISRRSGVDEKWRGYNREGVGI